MTERGLVMIDPKKGIFSGGVARENMATQRFYCSTVICDAMCGS